MSDVAIAGEPPRPARSALMALLIVTTLATVCAGVLVGAEPLDWSAVLSGDAVERLILTSRLWHVLLAALTGGALALAGAALQALLENPLADPFVLGLSGGAAVGASIASVLAALLPPVVATWVMAVGTGPLALLGALGVALLALGLGRLEGRLVPDRLLLVGVVLNALCTAVVLGVQSLADPRALQQLWSWLMGSVAEGSGTKVAAAAAVVLVASVLLWRQAAALDLLTLGELEAHALGLNVARTRRTVLLLSGVLVAVAVSQGGLIGFVGLVVPHLVRLAIGGGHRLLLPASLLGGAAFLVLGDLGARLFFRLSGTLAPVGMVTALVGAPLLLQLLRRSGR